MKLLDSRQGTALRVLLRALVLCATAFGVDWSAEQVAAVQLALEAVLGVLVKVTPDGKES